MRKLYSKDIWYPKQGERFLIKDLDFDVDETGSMNVENYKRDFKYFYYIEPSYKTGFENEDDWIEGQNNPELGSHWFGIVGNGSSAAECRQYARDHGLGRLAWVRCFPKRAKFPTLIELGGGR